MKFFLSLSTKIGHFRHFFQASHSACARNGRRRANQRDANQKFSVTSHNVRAVSVRINSMCMMVLALHVRYRFMLASSCVFMVMRFKKRVVITVAKTLCIQGGRIILYSLTLPNINRFSKLFHCQNQEKICNNTITEDAPHPSVSLHYLVKCQVS